MALVITGPTASGKSALAYELANRFPVEVINLDSAQVYQGLDIGTRKTNPNHPESGATSSIRHKRADPTLHCLRLLSRCPLGH